MEPAKRKRIGNRLQVAGAAGITAAATGVELRLGLFVASVFVLLAGLVMDRDST